MNSEVIDFKPVQDVPEWLEEDLTRYCTEMMQKELDKEVEFLLGCGRIEDDYESTFHMHNGKIQKPHLCGILQGVV